MLRDRPRLGDAAATAEITKVLPKLILMVARPDFTRGYLTSWLDSYREHFAILAVADVDGVPDRDALGDAAVAIVGIVGPTETDGWVKRQIEWLRMNCAGLPIIQIVEDSYSEKSGAAEAFVDRSAVQGYIPTSTDISVASAALNLVIAGGCYFPAARDRRQTSIAAQTDPPRPRSGAFAKLTQREQAVLNVLTVGAQNKIIAHRLGMSISTVKAHVHSIIAKLEVRNRTEAVVAARTMQGSTLHFQRDHTGCSAGTRGTGDSCE
jgi:DNA-binding NarL/FixJ family response regulator